MYTLLDITGRDSIDFKVGADQFRSQVRVDTLYFDQNRTVLAFNGAENTDWDFISYSKALGSSQPSFRMGVRDGSWVTDHALTATGFDGAEDTDWENIQKSKLL